MSLVFILSQITWQCLISPLSYEQSHRQLPWLSRLVRTCQETCHLIKTLSTHCFSQRASKCFGHFERNGPNSASDLCPNSPFHGASGCTASFRAWMFTEKCSHLVVRWRCSPRPWKGGVRCCHLPSAPPPNSFTIRTGLVCPAAMPTQSCSCGSANLNVSCLVLVYYQRGIHHHSCQVSSHSFVRQTPVSPQLSGLLLCCDFLFTQHMLPNSFKRQLSFMKVFFINLSLDRCLTAIRHKPTSPCEALFPPKGSPSMSTTFKFSHKAIALRNNFPEISYSWASPKFLLYFRAPAKSAFWRPFRIVCQL